MTRFTIDAPADAMLDAVEVTAAGGRLAIRAAAIALPQDDAALASLGEVAATRRPLPAPWRFADEEPRVVALPRGDEALVVPISNGNGGHGLRVIRRAGGSALVADAQAGGPIADTVLAEVAELVSGIAATIADDGIRLTMSADELAAAAELAGVKAFPGLDDAEPLDEPRLHRARQALVARGFVRFGGDGRPFVDPMQSGVLTPALRAILTLHVDHAGERRLYHLAPPVAVEHAPGPLQTHRFQTFPAGELIARLGQFAGMGGRPQTAADPVTLPASTFDRLLAGADGARDVAPDAAAPLVDALARPHTTTTVRALRRAGGRVKGGEMSWLDAGDGGIWDVERSGSSVRVTPSSPTALLDRLRALLA